LTAAGTPNASARSPPSKSAKPARPGAERRDNAGQQPTTQIPEAKMSKPTAAHTLMMALLAWTALTLGSSSQAHVLVEAEGFDDPGGWALDQQSMDQMGSPYRLAHGFGVPVADAVTTVALPAPGTYRVWVRTRDWVANWNAPGAPGKFQLLLNGRPLATTFGTEGAKWHWQDGGTVEIQAATAKLALHDLTGFEGRCDAIVLTRDMNFVPPNEGDEMRAFRRKAPDLSVGARHASPSQANRFDLVVVGGGMAGTCTAISAARLGLQVALVQNRPVLGGNNSSEIRVHLNGEINLPPYPRLGDVVRELDSGKRGNAQPASHYDDDRKLGVVRAEPNIHLFLNTHAYKVEKQGDRLVAIVARELTTSRELRFSAPLFADCTGDGTIGYLAGADWRMGRESKAETGESMAPETPDKMTMGASVQWYSAKTDQPSPFPDCPWALEFNDASCQNATRGDWDWESGLNNDQITEIEHIRDHTFRAIYGNWAFQKNHSKDKAKYANLKLDWVAYIAGKRESRRLLGDVILQQQDIEEFREFPDAFVTTTWSIDLHYPAPKNSEHFPGMEFRTICVQPDIKPYPIPYRCLYSRNVENLFMAGRNISVTHVALGTIRVMRTGGMMGELVGMAASLCAEHDTTPRGIYQNHLDELKALATRGVGKDSVKSKIKPQNARLRKSSPRSGDSTTLHFDSYTLQSAEAKASAQIAGYALSKVQRWLHEKALPVIDPQTGLYPADGKWNYRDTAADCYPFLCWAAFVVDKDALDGPVRNVLHAEQKLCNHLDRIPVPYDWQNKTKVVPDYDELIFQASEYVKDGLIAIVEVTGKDEWFDRMLAIEEDIWKHARYDTPYGKIPSKNVEVNGEQLQALARLYTMTGKDEFLTWAERLADYYFDQPDFVPERLRDHGCEIIGGLGLLYAVEVQQNRPKAKVYEARLKHVFDTILAKGCNEDGMMYNHLTARDGGNGKLSDGWGYNYVGYLCYDMATGRPVHRTQVERTLKNLAKPAYDNYNWEGNYSIDGFADSIEGAIYLLNRVPVEEGFAWVDREMARSVTRSGDPLGTAELWGTMKLEANGVRTVLMHALMHTQGVIARPWQKGLQLGAVRVGPASDGIIIVVRSDQSWSGTLCFDIPRHREYMGFAHDWPRMNTLPEWYTVEPARSYTVGGLDTEITTTGQALHKGLPLTLEPGQEKHLLIRPL